MEIYIYKVYSQQQCFISTSIEEYFTTPPTTSTSTEIRLQTNFREIGTSEGNHIN